MTLTHRGYRGSATVFDGKWMVSVEVSAVVVTTCQLKDNPEEVFRELVDRYIEQITPKAEEPEAAE